MASTVVDLPVGSRLEHEIDAIEAQDHDAVVSATVAKRVKIANAKATPLKAHEDVFVASKARLMARLSGNADA
jgi:hypothetical protein